MKVIQRTDFSVPFKIAEFYLKKRPLPTMWLLFTHLPSGRLVTVNVVLTALSSPDWVTSTKPILV